MVVYLIATVAAGALAAGGYLLVQGSRLALQGDTRARFRSAMGDARDAGHAAGAFKPRGRVGVRLERELARTGLVVRYERLLTYIGLVVLVGVLSAFVVPPVLALAGTLGALLLGYGLLRYRTNQRTELLRHQITGFLGHVVRALEVGRNLEGAFELAMAKAEPPLAEATARMRRRLELGSDLTEALDHVADLYRLPELELIATAVRINQRYGGLVSDVFRGVIEIIEEREQARRELRALTGETRVTAWVLGVMPPAVAIYMMVLNPSYLGGMWADPAGRTTLIVAVVMQVIGAISLWRMINRY